MIKQLKWVSFDFDGKNLTIDRIVEDELGGARQEIVIPYRNLYSLISFSIKAYHAKTAKKAKIQKTHKERSRQTLLTTDPQAGEM